MLSSFYLVCWENPLFRYNVVTLDCWDHPPTNEKKNLSTKKARAFTFLYQIKCIVHLGFSYFTLNIKST